MKRFLITILCIAFLVSLNSEPVFRGSEWGMSIEEVKAIENADLMDESTEQIFYRGTIAGLKTIIVYEFFRNQLTSCGYMIDETYTNKNEHINNFQKLKELLTKKYGEPLNDNVTWDNDLFRDDPSQYGMAISIGHLSFRVDWKKDNLQLTMILYGKNYDIVHGIFYSSPALQKQADKAKEEDVLNDL